MRTPEHILLPGGEQDLLRKELENAFRALGFSVSMPACGQPQNGAFFPGLAELLDSRPSLLFSVNFKGLTPLRQSLDLLRRAACGVAVWFVDNPWNVLSGVRDPLWKSLPLFVTDESFIGPLQKSGAQRVHHLPLAAAPELFSPDITGNSVPPPDDLAPFVFVGRSAFPGKKEFFSGLRLPEEAQKQAVAMLPHGQRPDAHWWGKRLRCTEEMFWPGKKNRLPALGAEEANLAWRSLCLRAAASAGRAAGAFPGLDVFGDAGWEEHLPPAGRLRPPVDYYTRLPGIYRRARYNLCLTSLQLPHGLNQRHFDIWTAGGLCISDATPGLSLFPPELTRPILFHKPEHIPGVIEKLETNRLRSSLIKDWQSHLKEKHSYRHRMRTMLEVLEDG